MKRSLSHAILVILLGLRTVSFGLPSGVAQSEVTADEYNVYTAVISKMFAGNKVTFDSQSKIKLLVIKDHTVSNRLLSGQDDEALGNLKQQFSSLTEETIDDYETKNKDSYPLKGSFDLKIIYVIVEKKEIEEIFKSGAGGWQEFYKRYPDSGGFVSFSRVGFNREMNQALVYIQHGCGGLCGTGHYVFLSKGDEGWKVDKMHMAWIS